MKKHNFVRLAGVTYNDAQENIEKFGAYGRHYDLIREPGNAHDPNAISVRYQGEHFMGYIPRGHAAILAPMMDLGEEFVAVGELKNVSPYHDTIGLTVKIVDSTGLQQ